MSDGNTKRPTRWTWWFAGIYGVFNGGAGIVQRIIEGHPTPMTTNRMTIFSALTVGCGAWMIWQEISRQHGKPWPASRAARSTTLTKP